MLLASLAIGFSVFAERRLRSFALSRFNMSKRVAIPSRWADVELDSPSRVETLQLRPGVIVTLNEIAPGDACEFHCIEAEDVFGIGFHLLGGSRFDMEGTRFATKPLAVHAGAAPRSSTSSFVLPAEGFRTISIRFDPAAACDLFDRHGIARSGLAKMAATARESISAARLAPLNAMGVAMVEAMFSAPYHGAGRSLYLESCALHLLAAQFEPMAPGGEYRTMEMDRGISQARDYLDAHLTNPPSIVQLARICGINDFKLKRDFKAAFGTTIFGYVRQRRMEQAARQLHQGLSVAHTADNAGYACPRCFADAFRRHFGMLPSEVSRAAIQETPARYG